MMNKTEIQLNKCCKHKILHYNVSLFCVVCDVWLLPSQKKVRKNGKTLGPQMMTMNTATTATTTTTIQVNNLR